MRLKLPEQVSSTQDLKALIIEIRQYARWYGQTAVKQQVTGHRDSDLPIVSPAASALLNDWGGGKPLSRESLDELIKSLSEYEATAPKLTITLAAPAPGSLRKSLLAWCRQNIDENILVNFKFNATILGGMVVNFGSHVYDWSFRRQILAAREKFPEELRRV